MNRLAEAIPTEFKPDTAFVLSLHIEEDDLNVADETFTPRFVVLPPEDKPARPGVQWSALND
jgi:hypothetical protein